MPTSETTLVRRELVAVVREKDQMRTEFDGYKKRAEARFAADAGTISELRLENASQAARLKARAAAQSAGSACPDCGGTRAGEPSAVQSRMEELQRQLDEANKLAMRDPSDREKELEKQIAEANKKLALYDNHNNPGAKAYNKKRDEFRKKHGTYDKDAGTRKIGPPVGHEGKSHNRKSSETLWFRLEACPLCGASGTLSIDRPSVKQLVEKEKTVTIAAERAWCSRCRKMVVADSPSIKGTHMGPGMLGIIAEYAAQHVTDRGMSRFSTRLHGVPACPNAMRYARWALTALFEVQMRYVHEYMAARATYLHRDETPVIINGKRGYAWIACWGQAVMVVVAGSRARDVMTAFFSKLHDIPSVTDEYSAYKHLPDRQSCSVHLLRRAESCAVRSGKESDVIPYLLLRDLFRRANALDTAPPEVIAEFESQMLEIAEMYDEGHEMRTALINALPTAFTFLKHAGMPSQNNRAEQELHAGPAREKRIRCQLKNWKGMKCMSVLSTVFRTAENLGIWPSMAVWMAVHVPGWNMMDHADGPGPPCETQARSPQVPGAAA